MLRLWDVRTRKETWSGRASWRPWTAQFFADNKLVVMGSVGGIGLTFWDAETHEKLFSLGDPHETIYKLQITADQTRVITLGGLQLAPSDDIKIWDVKKRTLEKQIKCHPFSDHFCLALSPDGEKVRILAPSDTRRQAFLEEINIATGKKTLSKPLPPLVGAVLLPEERDFLAIATVGKELALIRFSFEKRMPVAAVPADDRLRSLTISNDGKRVLATDDKTVKCLEADSLTHVSTMELPKKTGVVSMALSPDGTLAIVGGDQDDGSPNATPLLLLYDVPNGKLLATLLPKLED